MTGGPAGSGTDTAQEVDIGTVRADLAAVTGAEPAGDLVLQRLSSGLSGAGVFRVSYRTADGGRGTAVVKIPDLAARAGVGSGVEIADPGVLDREVLLLRAGFAEEVHAAATTTTADTTRTTRTAGTAGTAGRIDVVHVPRVLALTGAPDEVRIWMPDHGESFAPAWTPERAIAVGGLAAAVHQLGDLPSVQSAGPGLSRRGYAAYAHHAPLCRANLQRLAAAGPLHDGPGHDGPRRDGPLTARQIDLAGRLLERTPWALAELDRRPLRFCHGDLHLRNIGGSRPDWLVTDWASAGPAPAGSDLAVFLSTYEVFGGDRGDLSRAVFAQELIRSYTAALAAAATPVPVTQIRDVVVLWWLTWGLHLRLGPGLRALLASADPQEAAVIGEDVRAGLDSCAAGLARIGTDRPWT